MSTISINTEELTKLMNSLKKEKTNLENIYNNLNEETDILKEYFQSGTSEDLYISYEDFKKRFSEILNYFNNDIEFLEKIVSKSYIGFEKDSNKKIDDDIAV